MRIPLIGKLLLLAAAVVASAPAYAAHPSLFFDATQVDALRTKAAGTHSAIYQPIFNGTTQYLGTRIASDATVTWTATGRTFNLGDKRDIGNSLVVFSFVSQISTDTRYFDLAKAWLLAVSSWGSFDLDGTHDLIQAHLLAGVCVAYDMLAPRLSATEQSQVRAAIQRNATEMMTAANNGIWWTDENLQNHNWVDFDAIGFAGLVLKGELASTTTQPWIDAATANGRKVNTLLNLAGDGFWHEGYGYAWYGLSWHLPFASALKRVTGADIGDIAMVKNFGNAFAHMQFPNRPNQFVLTNGDFFNHSLDMGLLPLRYAASRYKDGVAQAAANNWVAGVQANTYAPELNQRVFEFFFYDASVPATALSSQPLDFAGADMQSAVFRSGWDSNALIFALKNGPIGGNAAWQWQFTGVPFTGTFNISHDHADDNGFYLYGNGSWLAPEAEGYFIGHTDSPGEPANKTAYHNALTIDGTGQLGEGVRTSGDSASHYAWYFDRKGSIPFSGSSTHFAYSLGDGAKLYASTFGLKKWDRHALFLDRKYVVIRDVVQASAAHTYGWNVHFMNGVAQEGSWLHGTAENGQALGVAMVAPTSFTASFTAQKPVNVSNFNKNGSVWRAEVKPTTAAANTTFLAALVPTSEANWAYKPEVTAIDPALPDGGVRIRESATQVSLAVFNDTSTQTRKVGSFTLTGQAAVLKYDNGNPTRALLVRGTSLADAARTLISVATPDNMLEVDGINTATVTVSGDPLVAARLYAPWATRVVWNGTDALFTREGDFVVVSTGAVATGGTGGSPQTSTGGDGSSTGTSTGGTTGTSDGSASGSVGSTDGTPTTSPSDGAGGSGLEGGVSASTRLHSCSSSGVTGMTAFGLGVVLAELVWSRSRRRATYEE